MLLVVGMMRSSLFLCLELAGIISHIGRDVAQEVVQVVWSWAEVVAALGRICTASAKATCNWTCQRETMR